MSDRNQRISRTTYQSMRKEIVRADYHDLNRIYQRFFNKPYSAWCDYINNLELECRCVSENDYGVIDSALFYSDTDESYYFYLGTYVPFGDSLPW